jgi:hypothetical protein
MHKLCIRSIQNSVYIKVHGDYALACPDEPTTIVHTYKSNKKLTSNVGLSVTSDHELSVIICRGVG